MAGRHLSVVVPTRNRCRAIARLLDSLGAQAAGAPEFDVVVVDDGSTDATVDLLTRRAWPFPLHLVQQKNGGAAAARNAGARAAAGDVLLFLDDDVVAEPTLLAAHARVHGGQLDLVAIGDLPPVVDDSRFLGVMLRYWWGTMQHAIRRPGHRYAFTDVLSGHCSLRRAQFDRLGGFDETLRCREDYEFGFRAIAGGLRLRFLPDAVAWHYDDSNMKKVMARKLAEGVADVYLARCHPGLAMSLPLRFRLAEGRMAQQMIQLAWTHPKRGDLAARGLMAALTALEALRLRWKWQAVLNVLLTYWYWRGAASALGSPDHLDALLEPPAAVTSGELLLDLVEGIPHAEARLDAARPRSARLVMGRYDIGNLPDLPGAEPLEGSHLRPLLVRTLRREYLAAMTASGAVPRELTTAAERLIARNRSTARDT